MLFRRAVAADPDCIGGPRCRLGALADPETAADVVFARTMLARRAVFEATAGGGMLDELLLIDDLGARGAPVFAPMLIRRAEDDVELVEPAAFGRGTCNWLSMLCKLARRRAVSSARDEVVIEDDTVETSPPSLIEVSPSTSGAASPAMRSRSNKERVGKMGFWVTGAAVEGTAEVARDGEASSTVAWTCC